MCRGDTKPSGYTHPRTHISPKCTDARRYEQESEHDGKAAGSAVDKHTKIREVDLVQPLMHVRPRRLDLNIVAVLETL